MKRFEEQRQYKPSSTDYDLGNGPLTAPDIGSLIRQEFQRTRQQDQYADTVRQQNANVQSENDRIRFEKSAAGDRRQSEFNLKELIPFSNKLFDLAVGEVKGAQKREALKGQMDVLSLQDPSKFEGERLERYLELKNAAIKNGATQQLAANEAFQKTKQLEIADMFRKGTPEYQFQLVSSMLQLERDNFQNVLAEQVQRQDKFLTLPGQDPVPYNQVTGEAATGALGHKIIADHLTELGFEGINPMMMEDYFYGGQNGVRTQLAKWKQAKVNIDTVNSGQNSFDQKFFLFQQNFNSGRGTVTDVYDAAGTLPKLVGGKVYAPSPTDRWKTTEDRFVGLGKAGALKSHAHIQALFDRSIDPVTNQPMSISRLPLMQKIKRAHTQYLKDQGSELVAQRAADGRDFVTKAVGEIKRVAEARGQGDTNVTTFEEKQQMQEKYKAITHSSTPSPEIENAWLNYSEGGKNLEQSFQSVRRGFETGQYGMDYLDRLNLEEHPQYEQLKQDAQRNDRLLGDDKEMKWIREHALLKAKAVSKIGPDSPGTTENVERIADVLAERARPIALQYMAEMGLDKSSAMKRALDEVAQDARDKEGFAEGETAGFLAPGIQNDFPNFKLETLKEYKAQDAIHAAAMKKAEGDMQKFGTNYSAPNSFISDERVAAWQPDPVNGGFDPVIKMIADRDPNITTFELTNLFRNRLNLPPLPMPASMARFRESTQIPDEAFNQFLKDVDKARTSYDISKAGYNANTGLQSWRAPDTAREQIVKVAQESGLPEGAVLAYAHMSNKNFSLDYAKLSANIQQLSATAKQGGLTGEAREDYIFASLLGEPPKIVDGQLKLTDAQQVNLDNLVKNRASFADPAVMNSGANLNPTYRKVSNNTLPSPTEYQTAAPGLTPEERAWLRVTRYAEGGRGYNIMFGGSTFQGTDHPRRVNTAGGYSSDAAGAYQFLSTTWDGISKKLGLKGGLTPANQDKASLGLMIEKGVDPKKGWSDKALYKLSPVWASFPKDKSDRSYYDQPSKTTADMKQKYEHFLQQERQRDQQQNTMI
jgi:muramidase (phage lysozyme)